MASPQETDMDHDYDSSAILGDEEDDAPAGAWSLGELDESSDLESLRQAWMGTHVADA
jgi:hypothetical protein